MVTEVLKLKAQRREMYSANNNLNIGFVLVVWLQNVMWTIYRTLLCCFCVLFEDVRITVQPKMTVVATVQECFQSFVPFCPRGRREVKMKENQRARECQRSDKGRWAKGKQHLSTYLKSPAVRAHHTSSDFTRGSRNHYKGQSKQIFPLCRAQWKAGLLLVVGRKSQRVSLMEWKSIQLPAGISCGQQRESEIKLIRSQPHRSC